MRLRTIWLCLFLVAFAGIHPALAANDVVKATALEAGCKAQTVDIVRQETGTAPQTLYKVTCVSTDSKTHTILVQCTLDDCSVLNPPSTP